MRMTKSVCYFTDMAGAIMSAVFILIIFNALNVSGVFNPWVLFFHGSVITLSLWLTLTLAYLTTKGSPGKGRILAAIIGGFGIWLIAHTIFVIMSDQRYLSTNPGWKKVLEQYLAGLDLDLAMFVTFSIVTGAFIVALRLLARLVFHREKDLP